MRSSAVVGLLLTGSMSIFGIYAALPNHHDSAPGPAPVWLAGQRGIYDPDTGEFISANAPEYEPTVELIRQRQQYGTNQTAPPPDPSTTRPYSSSNSSSNSNGSNGYHPYQTNPNSYSPSFFHSSYTGGYSSFSGAEEGSARGGFGETGHAMGMGHE